MGHVVVRTEMHTTPDAIWALLCDVRRYPEWDAFADEILSASHDRLQEGSTYRERTGKDESDWTVTLFEPMRRQVHVGQVPFLGEITVAVDLEPHGDRTFFHHEISYHVMPGLLRPIGWLIEKAYVDRYARNNMLQMAANAKRILEGAAAR